LKGKSPETLMLRFVWLESLIQDYSNEEIGQMVRDLYLYAKEGTEPPPYQDRGMRGLWRSMKDGVDKDAAKYSEKSAKAAASANARWNRQSQQECENMQMNASASDRIRSHPTYTCTSTDTPTCRSTDTITLATAPTAAVAPHEGALGGMTVLDTANLKDGETEKARKRFLDSIKNPAWSAAQAAPPDIEKEV